MADKMSEKQTGKQSQQPDHQIRRSPPPFPPPSCPRCYSNETRFGYYNNSKVSQPRYYCRNCRRFWTHGGTLRDVPKDNISQKRQRDDGASSSSVAQAVSPSSLLLQFSSPSLQQPPRLNLGFPIWGPKLNFYGGGSDVGCSMHASVLASTMLTFNSGCYFDQMAFKFSFGSGNPFYEGFYGGVPPPLPPPQLFPSLNFDDLLLPDFQPSSLQTFLTSQSMARNRSSTTTTTTTVAATTTTTANHFFSIQGPMAGAEEISTNEWLEVFDLEIEGGTTQGYGSQSP